MPLDGTADLKAKRNAGMRHASDASDSSAANDVRGGNGNGDTLSDRKDGNGDKRETKREPRRLRDKEIGNVVKGQRDMPEILSPCG
jgi:hypothetical protein